ncbi:MAG: SurA N-terminal domain-containing protein, partial [Proteobacteria bacterium]|nr:SurA N-terminal domain-containing protein [Pseudomonadota bacterium]
MAKPIHKQITSVLGFFLFAILIASFAFFGAGSIVSQPGAIVASVGDQKITVTDFVNSFDNEIARYREQFGPEFDTQAALAIGLDQGVVNQLVQRASLDQQAEDLGLLGSTGEVRYLIREMDAFKDLNGNFSEFTYKQRLAIAGMSAEQFASLPASILLRELRYTIHEKGFR